MNEKKITLIGNVIKFAFIAIGVILCALVITGPNADSSVNSPEVIEQFRESGTLGAAVGFTGFLIMACAGLVVLFFVLLLISNFKKAIKSMLGIIAFGIIYFVLSAIGTGDNSESLQLINPIDQPTLNSTHAGIITAMIGLAVVVLAVIAGPFMGRLRK
jgi:hypothetical protein